MMPGSAETPEVVATLAGITNPAINRIAARAPGIPLNLIFIGPPRYSILVILLRTISKPHIVSACRIGGGQKIMPFFSIACLSTFTLERPPSGKL
jgi:hypothetical protein